MILYFLFRPTENGARTDREDVDKNEFPLY